MNNPNIVLTLNEASIVSLYAAPTRSETVERMADAPVEEMEQSIHADFFSALRKIMAMDEAAYQGLDLRDVLVTDEEDTSDGDK